MKVSQLLRIILPAATAALAMQGSIAAAATFGVSIIANGPGNAFFYPANITIAAGDTVIWHWPAMVCSHSVTSGADCQVDGLFDSGVHNVSNFIFTSTFPSPGTYNYFSNSSTTECRVAVGSVTVAGGTPPPSGSQLLNISTRMRAGIGDNVLIAGFIVTGNDPKKVLVRALAPSLPVPGKLADPILELVGPSGTIATNDNWKDAPNMQAIIDSTIPPPNDLESAILTTLPAHSGAYTAIVRGAGDTTGVALVEVYDLEQAADSQLANISTRGLVKTDSDVMIGGFILGPEAAGGATILVRALGPSLSGMGVSGVLANPVLDLRNVDGDLVMTNDNWKSDQQAEIEATGIPPGNDLESAMVVTLAPAAYTAIVSGQNGGTGVGLVEIYRLP